MLPGGNTQITGDFTAGKARDLANVLKYGSLPVARATGGIQQIIEDYDPVADNGYGFLCYEYSAEAFWDALKRARGLFRERKLWTKLIKRAMARNFLPPISSGLPGLPPLWIGSFTQDRAFPPARERKRYSSCSDIILIP